MDLTPQPKAVHPKWVGLLAAFFLPGSAHYLSGHRKTGLLLYGGTLLLPMVGMCTTALPAVPAIYLGLALTFLIAPLFFLAILSRSYRSIARLSPKQWGGFVLVLIGLKLLGTPLIFLIPATVYQLPTGAMSPPFAVYRWRRVPMRPRGQTHYFWVARPGNIGRRRPGRSGQTPSRAMKSHSISGKNRTALPAYLSRHIQPRTHYEKSDLIWSGTVIEGDRVAANKWAYLFSRPSRGDLVTFHTKGLNHEAVRPDTIYIKRIVGLPGEQIQIIHSRLHVNGKMIDEPSVFQELHYQNAGLLDAPEKMILLEPDEYLTLGDNTAPNMSMDGRYYGPIQADSIIAKVQTIYWPFNRIRVAE